MKPIALLLAALCGAIITIAFMPRAVPDSGDAPEMADNAFELRSLTMANESAKRTLAEYCELVKLWRARAMHKAVSLPLPETRKN